MYESRQYHDGAARSLLRTFFTFFPGWACHDVRQTLFAEIGNLFRLHGMESEIGEFSLFQI